MIPMELGKVAKTILRTCVNAVPSENITIITDSGYSQELIESLLVVAQAEGIGASLVTLAPSDVMSPPSSVVEALKETDAAIICTSTSWRFSSQATKAALAAKSRVLSLSRFSEADLTRAIPVDYDQIKRDIEKIISRLKDTYTVHIKTEAGTDVRLEGEGKTVMFEDGIVKPGEWDTVPGVVFAPTAEDRTEGVVVIDGSLGYFPLETGDVTQMGIVKDQVTLEIKKGRIVHIEGGKSGRDLQRIITRGGDNADVIAEWGIGLNPGTKLSGNFLADESLYGAAHFGIGANTQMGGKTRCKQHIDTICLDITLQIDGETVMKEGTLMV